MSKVGFLRNIGITSGEADVQAAKPRVTQRKNATDSVEAVI
jgi:hypothetical protein